MSLTLPPPEVLERLLEEFGPWRGPQYQWFYNTVPYHGSSRYDSPEQGSAARHLIIYDRRRSLTSWAVLAYRAANWYSTPPARLSQLIAEGRWLPITDADILHPCLKVPECL